MKRYLPRRVLIFTVIASMLLAMFGFNMSVLAETPLEIDLDVNDSAMVNGALWVKSTHNYATGTGIFYSFVQMQKNGVQKGYNTDYRPQQFDEKASANFNRAVGLSMVPIEMIEGVAYREFLLDVNQTAANPYLSLDKFQIWLTDNPEITGYDLETYSFDTTEATKVYDLDEGNEEVYLKLDYRISSGSGRDNYRVYIPQENFDGVDGEYVVIFAEHGNFFAANNGFEEWGVRLGTEPFEDLYEICGYKFDAGAYDEETESYAGIEGWTIYLYDGMLEEGEDPADGEYVAVTTTDENGLYCFEGLSEGTYYVYEEIREGWMQLGPAFYEVTLPGGNADPDTGEPLYFDFMNAAVYNICGTKFFEDGETPLDGWVITLEKLMYDEVEDEWVVDPTFDALTAVTGDEDAGFGEGEYCFDGLRAGTYRVTETLKSGWVNISELSYDIVLPGEDFEPGDTFTQNFVNGPDYVCYDDTIWAYGGALATENSSIRHAGNNWGWTNYIEEEGTYEFDLYAGAGRNILANGMKVGTAKVVYNDGCVEVTYTVDGIHTLMEAHLWIGDEELPRDNRGRFTAAPGQFPYSPEIAEDGLSASFTLCDVEGPVWVAAHGVVEWCELHPDYDGPEL